MRSSQNSTSESSLCQNDTRTRFDLVLDWYDLDMGRKTILAPDEFYHIYNRGTEKRDIFKSVTDHKRFVTLLHLCNSLSPVHIGNFIKLHSSRLSEFDPGERLVDIVAYCLMPNHFHLLIHEKQDGGTSKFMQKLLTGYTMYFNKRYDRTGALFQGKFKASHANEDRYLKYLISYIHLNPVKLIDSKWKENGIKNRKQAEQYLEEYPYSSYREYLGHTRDERVLINLDVLPQYFETPKDFESNVTEWLTYIQE